MDVVWECHELREDHVVMLHISDSDASGGEPVICSSFDKAVEHGIRDIELMYKAKGRPCPLNDISDEFADHGELWRYCVLHELADDFGVSAWMTAKKLDGEPDEDTNIRLGEDPDKSPGPSDAVYAHLCLGIMARDENEYVLDELGVDGVDEDLSI